MPITSPQIFPQILNSFKFYLEATDGMLRLSANHNLLNLIQHDNYEETLTFVQNLIAALFQILLCAATYTNNSTNLFLYNPDVLFVEHVLLSVILVYSDQT